MLDIVERFANFIIPVVSVFASYAVGRLQSTQEKRLSATKEAYEKFYVPFIRTLYTQRLCNLPFSELSLRDQMEIYNLLLNSLQYMDKDTIYTMEPFFYEFSLMLAQQAGVIENHKFAAENTDGIFSEAVEQILNRAIKIAKTLRLPTIAEVVLEDFLQARKSQEKAPKKS